MSTTSRMPRAGRSSRMWARIGLPATCSSTLGVVYVWGLSRVPTPATGMIAIGLLATSRPLLRKSSLEFVDARERRGGHAGGARQVETQIVHALDQRGRPRPPATSSAD